MAKRAKQGSIFIGTSSWVDRNLVASGRFYPEEVKESGERLAYYARHFNLAEIDSTYYALPSRRNTSRWAETVPEGFRFNVKAFALFTQHPTRLSSIPKSFHEALPPALKKKARCYYKDVPPEVTAELWQIFRRALGPMREADRFGAVLVDFPPWFVPNDDNRAFLAHVREQLPDERAMVEFRNNLWVSDGETADVTFGLLRDLGLGFCCVDEPPGLKGSFPPVARATSSIAAVRFRGRNAARWEDKSASMEERLDWSYTDDELSEWLPRIEALRNEAEEVYLTFNTKVADQGVANAIRMKKLLGLAA